MSIRICLLGGIGAACESGVPVRLRTRPAQALLALLARHPGRRHARTALGALLWPETPTSGARTNLRQALRQLRRSLPPDAGEVVRGDRDAIWLDPGRVDVDVARLERAHARGERHALEEAAALCRGEFLAGFEAPGEPYGQWMTAERVAVRELAVGVLHELLPGPGDACALETGPVVQTALGLLALDPTQESVHRLLIRAYLAQNRPGAAREQYRWCETVLRDELGVEPEADTRALLAGTRAAPRRPQAGSPPPGDGERPGDTILGRAAVAVRAFVDLSSRSGPTWLGDGLSEEIITALAGWRRFPVIASTSSFAYRDPASSAPAVGAELGARYVVSGSFRGSGRRTRVAVRLVDAESDRILTTESFDVKADDMLDMQLDAAGRIAAFVEPALESAELGRIVPKRTEDLTAWDRYLQGAALLNRYSVQCNAQARAAFQRSIELDHGYSDAFMGLAASYLRDMLIEPKSPSRASRLAAAFEAARNAAELDPDSSSARFVLGTCYVWAEDLDTAIGHTQTAIALNPSNAHARLGLGNRLDLAGRTGAGIRELERGLKLNPRDPRGWVYMGYLARAHLDARCYEDALSWARRALQARPDQPHAHHRLAACLAHLGRFEEAAAALAECERLAPGFVERMRDWRPYPDPRRSEHYRAGLLGL